MNRSAGMPPGSWIALGAGVGAAIGVALDNIAIGIAVGTAMGVLLMAVQSNRTTRDDDSGDEE